MITFCGASFYSWGKKKCVFFILRCFWLCCFVFEKQRKELKKTQNPNRKNIRQNNKKKTKNNKSSTNVHAGCNNKSQIVITKLQTQQKTTSNNPSFPNNRLCGLLKTAKSEKAQKDSKIKSEK